MRWVKEVLRMRVSRDSATYQVATSQCRASIPKSYQRVQKYTRVCYTPASARAYIYAYPVCARTSRTQSVDSYVCVSVPTFNLKLFRLSGQPMPIANRERLLTAKAHIFKRDVSVPVYPCVSCTGALAKSCTQLVAPSSESSCMFLNVIYHKARYIQDVKSVSRVAIRPYTDG